MTSSRYVTLFLFHRNSHFLTLSLCDVFGLPHRFHCTFSCVMCLPLPAANILLRHVPTVTSSQHPPASCAYRYQQPTSSCVMCLPLPAANILLCCVMCLPLPAANILLRHVPTVTSSQHRPASYAYRYQQPTSSCVICLPLPAASILLRHMPTVISTQHPPVSYAYRYQQPTSSCVICLPLPAANIRLWSYVQRTTHAILAKKLKSSSY